MDQEDEQLEDAVKSVEDALMEHGIKPHLQMGDHMMKRLRYYSAEWGQKQFDFALVVNGLDVNDDVQLRYGKHSIEDHLLFAAGMTDPRQFSGSYPLPRLSDFWLVNNTRC